MKLQPARLLIATIVIAWFVGWQALFLFNSPLHPVLAIAAALFEATVLGFILAGFITELLWPAILICCAAVAAFAGWVTEPRPKPTPDVDPAVLAEAWREVEQLDSIPSTTKETP